MVRRDGDIPTPAWDSVPSVAIAAASLLHTAGRVTSESELLEAGLTLVGDCLDARQVAVWVAAGGRWSDVAQWRHNGNDPPRRRVPRELLADCLDEGRALARHGWKVALMDGQTAAARHVLAVGADAPLDHVEAAAAALGDALRLVRQRGHDARRNRRMEAILQIAQQWYGTRDTQTLLRHMAEAATSLLDADRASIFLWDRATGTLVARPALGVEGNELRVDADKGIVGQVVSTGQPRMVNRQDDRSQINRTVDTMLDYTTETLLCVPIDSPTKRRLGAFEVVNKRHGDFTDDDQCDLLALARHAAVALENTRNLEKLLSVNRQLVDEAAADVELMGHSPAIEALRSTVQRVAQTDLAILVLGENGTGKEVLSRSVHYLSPRRDEPFIAVNCAALTETLLESELFGHEKGAFTDAHQARPGKFELASGGTLLLDEIGDMSPGGQAKLLRVLEEKIVVRVGGTTPIHTEVRVIAATNQNLAELVRRSTFREDLYYRLNVVTVELPPLRERGDDILLLAEHFLQQFCRRAGRRPPQLSAAARQRLLAHRWPGNVRELRNLMERLAYLLPADRVEAHDLAFILSPSGRSESTVDPNLPLTKATRQFQVDYIQRAVDAARGNMSDAAQRLGLHRSNLYRKMRQLGMATGEDGS